MRKARIKNKLRNLEDMSMRNKIPPIHCFEANGECSRRKWVNMGAEYRVRLHGKNRYNDPSV